MLRFSDRRDKASGEQREMHLLKDCLLHTVTMISATDDCYILSAFHLSLLLRFLIYFRSSYLFEQKKKNNQNTLKPVAKITVGMINIQFIEQKRYA